MTIKNVLQELNFKSNEIKQFNITVNSEKVDINKYECINYIDAGEFIYKNLSLFKDLKFLTIDEIFSCDIHSIRKKFENYSFLRITKKQSYILFI